MVPAGESHKFPVALVRRIVRFHLLDYVYGQTLPYAEADVKKAELTATVIKRDEGCVVLKLAGETHAETGTRGVRMKLLGQATWDIETGYFVEFEIVAVGTRWGGTRYNFRQNELEEAPLGIVLTMAGKAPEDRVPPAFVYRYGW